MPEEQGRKIPPQSTLVGSLLMVLGLAPPVLWIGHVTGILPLTTDLSLVILFGWPLFFAGLGGMLIRGEGRTVSDVATWWIKEKFGWGKE